LGSHFANLTIKSLLSTLSLIWTQISFTVPEMGDETAANIFMASTGVNSCQNFGAARCLGVNADGGDAGLAAEPSHTLSDAHACGGISDGLLPLAAFGHGVEGGFWHAKSLWMSFKLPLWAAWQSCGGDVAPAWR